MTGLIARCGKKLYLAYSCTTLWGLFRQQFIQLITTDVTEILPLHVVEDKLTNILAAVADTFD